MFAADGSQQDHRQELGPGPEGLESGQLRMNDIFRPARGRVPNDILQNIVESPNGEREFTFGGGGVEEEEEAYTPELRILDYEADEEPLTSAEESEPQSLTLARGELDSGEYEPSENSGDDEQPWEFEERVPRGYIQDFELPDIVRPTIDLVDAEQLMANRIERRYNQYVRCIHALLHDVDGNPDLRIMAIVDRGWGLYSPVDFEEAMVNRRPLPPCPRSRQDIIDMAMEQGYPIDTLPGTNGANPQGGAL
ncbi:hypothetical protein TWF696_003650 [Orbilia brochopaga]|uniref:Uncharacterized protein n=1 Tax=Orbilia brochopaga TaxID=3140254 RepID=A0AAV9V6Y4_9PEZI